VLQTLTERLFQARIVLEGTCSSRTCCSGQEVWKESVGRRSSGKTVRVLKHTVPAAVPGIAFLSAATSTRTRRPSRCHQQDGPGCREGDLLLWPRAAGRAAEGVVGQGENVAAAQRAFSHRAHMNGLATLGHWKADLEKKAA